MPLGWFNPENKFWNFIGKLVDVLLMSLLWALCSLPLFTVGAATSAFYHFTLHQVEDTEGGVCRSFFRAFARGFGRATACWLGLVLAFSLLLLDAWLCVQMGDVWYARVLLFALASIALMLVLTLLYLFPLIAVFDFPLKKIIPNAFVMAMGNLPVSVTVLVLFGLCGVGAYHYPIFFAFFFGLGVFLSSYFLLHVMGRYMADRGERAAAGRGEDEA